MTSEDTIPTTPAEVPEPGGDMLPDAMLPPAPEDLAPEHPELPRPERDKGLSAVEPLGEEMAWEPLLVTRRHLQDLWRRADVLQKRINREVNSERLAKKLLDQILQARNALREGDEQYEEAERLLNEVTYRLELQQRVRRWSREVGYKLFLYELVWLVVLVVLMLVAPMVLRQWATAMGYSVNPEAGVDSVQWLILGLKSAIWGGLGGVTGAMYALWRHIAREQDFDPQYTIWYLTSPIMGTVLGAFAFLAIQAGLFSLTAGTESRINSAAVVFLLAWMSGFQQNVVYNMVRRILQAFRLDDEEPREPPSDEAETRAG